MAETTLEGTHLTRAGFTLLAKALAGKQLKYTKIQIGDSMRNGKLVEPTREQQYEFTSLIGPKDFELPLIDCSFTGGGTVTVKFRLSNKELTEGFYNRELGIFAQDPDTKKEVLYCYRNVGNLCEWIPAGDSTNVYDVIVAVVTVVQEAANVTAIIDASMAYVSQAEFNEHIAATTPHPNAPSLKSEVTTTDNFWVTDSDSHLHPMTAENTRRLILGGDASTLPQLTNRVTQAETNIANLFMQLNAERDIGLQANLLLLEDFADSTHIDTYNVKIITTVAGVYGVELETDTDILAGHWYTITDGVRDEYVQVKSVAKNMGKVVAVFQDKLSKTYNLDQSQLMRTTALIRDGYAQGAGRTRSKRYLFAMKEPWQGKGAGAASVLTLGTTIDNADSFDISGDGDFTSKGEFTIA